MSCKLAKITLPKETHLQDKYFKSFKLPYTTQTCLNLFLPLCKYPKEGNMVCLPPLKQSRILCRCLRRTDEDALISSKEAETYYLVGTRTTQKRMQTSFLSWIKSRLSSTTKCTRRVCSPTPVPLQHQHLLGSLGKRRYFDEHNHGK